VSGSESDSGSAYSRSNGEGDEDEDEEEKVRGKGSQARRSRNKTATDDEEGHGYESSSDKEDGGGSKIREDKRKSQRVRKPRAPRVVSYYCTVEGCEKNASYGHKGHSPTHCGEHREEGMVATRGGRICAFGDCGGKAWWYLPDDDGQLPKDVMGRKGYCQEHKQDGKSALF